MSYTLTFSQLVGDFVTDKELVGAQDPYVIFEAGGKKAHTKAIKSAGAGTCEWKESYTLQEFAPKASDILEVTVYNHNTLRPDGTLGSGTVNLSNLGGSQLSGSGDRVTVPLSDKKGKSVGTLSFIIHGGGYSGRSGTGTGTGTGTGAGTGAAAAGVTGVGAGSNYGAAKTAADRAATENKNVSVHDAGGVAAGRPTHGTTTGTGYDGSRSTGTTTGTGANVHPGEVIDRKYYTGSESRPQEQALVEQYREHNPYAKQYETTVQHTGRERLVGSSIEALGTTERVVGQDHHVHAQPHDHIARALPKGAIADRPGGEGWVQGKPGPVCDSTTFEVTGDRTVDKERVTNLREHREFEKEFEVKTALTGERPLEKGGQTEHLNRERVLLDEKNKIACEGHPDVGATGGTGTRATTGTGSGTGATAGTGYGTGTGTRATSGAGSGYGTGTGGSATAGTGSGYGTGTGTSATTGTGSGYGTGTGATTGTGSGYGTGTGAHTGTGSGYGTGSGATTGTGSGYGTGTGAHTGTGSGYGTGSGATTGTGSEYGTGSGYGTGTGTKGSDYGTGTGTTQSPTSGMSTTQKIASMVPGTEANKEKKAAQGSTTY